MYQMQVACVILPIESSLQCLTLLWPLLDDSLLSKEGSAWFASTKMGASNH